MQRYVTRFYSQADFLDTVQAEPTMLANILRDAMSEAWRQGVEAQRLRELAKAQGRFGDCFPTDPYRRIP